MTLDEIRSQLGAARGVPRAALAAAVEQAEALAPEVVDLLDLACKGVMLTAPQENLLLYGVHALAAARRTELYEPLLALIEWRPDDIEVLLSDTELHLLLISCCGPEGEAPFDLLDNPNVPGFVKCSLFLLIARLVWEGRAPRAEFIALLDRFDGEPAAEPGDMAWLGWQHAISLLGLTEFEDRVRAGWEAGRLPFDRPQDREDWLEELSEAVQEPENPARFGPHHAEPVTDVFAALAWMGLLDPGEPEDEMDDPDDPARDIRVTEEEQDWLADFLLSEMALGAAMSPPCLDGYLSALAAGPIVVPRAEWWSRIWSDLDDQEPTFETEAQESYVNELVDRHLETIRRRLKTGYRHQPWIDVTSMTVSVEEWAIGYSIAMSLRPGAWDPIAEHTQAGLAVTSVYLLLPQEMHGEDWEPINDESRARIVRQLPDLIQMAYAFWHDQPVLPLFQPRRSAKVGRNEPCPCGSGRKYKKCCGAN